MSSKTFGNWFSTKKLWACVMRFINNCLSGNVKATGELSLREIEASEVVIERIVQTEHFREEINKIAQNKPVSSKSKLYKLNVFLDGQGLLRVGGRLQHGSLAYDVKHPVIMPETHDVTSLRSNPCAQKMSDLPSDRLSQSPPFLECAADCSGLL